MRKCGLLAAALAAVAWGVLAPAGGADPKAPAAATASRPAEAGVTFFAISDTHVGGADTDSRNAALVKLLGELPGQDCPAPLGGKIDKPAAVLAAGDLTDTGTAAQWQQFSDLFIGKPGAPNPLPGPLLECTGNHDRDGGRQFVLKGVSKRHGFLQYTADLGPVRVISMDQFAGLGGMKWLGGVLADTPKDRPLVFFMHYPVAMGGQLSAKDRRFFDALEGRRVAAILHGHLHGFAFHEVDGIPILNLPTVRGDHPGVAVLRITPTRIDIACRALEKGGFFLVKSLPLPPPVKPATQPASRPAACWEHRTGGLALLVSVGR